MIAGVETLDSVRDALRIKTNAFDGEIAALLDACEIDLRMAGVSVLKRDDPSFLRAATLYCKANFGYEDDSEKFRAAYNGLRDSMALSREYGDVQNIKKRAVGGKR